MPKWHQVCNRQLKDISGLSFITAHVAFAITNETKVVRIDTEFFILLRAEAPNIYVRAWMLCCFHSSISNQTFRRALTASADSCAEIKSALQWREQLWKSLDEGAGKRCLEYGRDLAMKPQRKDAIIGRKYELAANSLKHLNI